MDLIRLEGRGPAALAAFALLLLLAGVACSGPDGAPAERRKVVLIVIDTLRADRLPFYGCEKNTAPFLSSLAERSLVFENAWSASSWTAPATASIFTSTYPNQHGVITGMRVFRSRHEEVAEIELNRIPDSLETVPVFMKSRGYQTFGVSANLNIAGRLGFDRGFDRFEMLQYRKGNGAPELVSRMLEWSDQILNANRFFLYLHFMDPHAPYARHEQWIEPGAPPTPEPKADRDAYDSEIRYVDEQIRRLFEEFALDEGALVVVTSDHGQEFYDHGGLGHGFQLYSELTRVPLLVHVSGAGAPRGRVGRNVTTLDILPTLRGVLGAPRSDRDVGVALLGAGDSAADRGRELFSMRTRILPEETSRKRAVVRGGFRLIITEPAGTAELYDLTSDRGERRDVAEAHPERVRELQRILDEQERAGDPSSHARLEAFRPTPEEVKLLERLGYVEDTP